MTCTNAEMKGGTQTDCEKPEVPEDFICIDPQQRIMVFEFLTNLTPSLKQQALIHLKLCLYCREIAETLLDPQRCLPTEAQYYLFKNRVVASDHIS